MSQVPRDPLIDNIFENLVILEALKTRYNQGKTANLYFFRDAAGHEIDLLFKSGRELTGIEIKAASTWHHRFKKGLDYFSEKNSPLAHRHIIYSGDPHQFSDGTTASPFTDVRRIINS